MQEDLIVTLVARVQAKGFTRDGAARSLCGDDVMTEAIPAAATRLQLRHARMMLFRAFLAQNFATGCAFGGLGVSVLALEERFGTSRGMTAMVLAFVILTMSGLGPVVAGLVVRVGIRRTMLAGLAFSTAGYVALALAPTMAIAFAACALLIGPGSSMLGGLSPSLLAGGWFPATRGRAVGITYIPLFIALVPIAGIAIIEHYGLSALFLSIAAVHTLCLPLFLGVRDPPVVDNSEVQEESDAVAGGHPLVTIISRPVFWAIVVGNGILNATAITGVTQIMAILSERGHSPQIGALGLSFMGGASIVGSILAGHISDRFGAARTLALAGVGFAASWAVIASTGWPVPLMLAMVVAGACGGSIYPPINVLAVHVFGAEALPRALGLLSLCALPFTFCLPPAAGALRDVLGNYGTVMMLMITASLVVALGFLLMNRMIAAGALVRQSF